MANDSDHEPTSERDPAGPRSESREEAAARRRDELNRDLSRHMGLGLQFAVSVGVFTGLGVWLDGRVGTLPLFTILGVLIGATGATISLIRQVPPVRAERGTRPPASS